jgi:hypothetical protein
VALGTCADLPEACGVLGAGATALDCGSCFFRRTAFGPGREPSLVSTAQGLQLAYLNDLGEVWLARELPDGGFSRHLVDAIDARSAPSLKIGPDGTAHVAYQSNFEIWYAIGPLADGGFDRVRVGTGAAPSLALNPSGRPHLAYQGASAIRDIRHAVRADDGGWQETTIESFDGGLLGLPTVVLDPNAAPHILYLVRTASGSALHYKGAGAIEVVEPGNLGGGADGQLSAAFDSNGALHAVWPAYPFSLSYGVRTSAGWSVRPASSDNAGHENNALVLSPSGKPMVAFHNFSALNISGFTGSSFSVQGVLPCDQGAVSLVYDSAGRLRMATDCKGVQLLTLDGQYPHDHRSNCDQLSTLVCDKACNACSPGAGQCCMSATGTQTCTNRCTTNIGGRACSDATKAPTLTDQCLAAAGGLQCSMPAVEGVDLRGTPCDALFAAP